MLVPATAIAQRNRSTKRKAQKPKTETAASSQNTTIEEEKADNENNYIILTNNDDDADYTPSAEHNIKIDEFLKAYNTGNNQAANNDIKNYINSLSEGQKKSFNASVLDHISPTLGNNQFAAALALIDLYQTHSSKSNKMMPMLYYIKGNIYATLRDSIGLRESIDALSHYQEGEEYNTILNENLKSITEYVPDIKALEGTWIGTGQDTYFYGGMPNFLFDNTFEGNALFSKMRNYTYITCLSGLVRPEEYTSQILVPYSNDSIFIAWCSEEISNKNEYVTALLRETTSNVASHLAGELNKSNSVASTLGSIGLAGAEVGINLLLSNLFMPSKKMYLVEARLKVLNSHMMRGNFKLKISKKKADGKSKAEEYNWDEYFFKWEPESDVAISAFMGKVLLPQGIDEDSFKNDKTTTYAQCKHGIDYNEEQIRQLFLYDYWKLKAKGVRGLEGVYKENGEKPFLGVEYEELNQENSSKYNIKGGIKIKKIFKGSPAHIYGLKNGDIIDIDRDRFYQFHSGQNVQIRFFRGKKEHSTNLKLSFPFIPQYEKWWGFSYTNPDFTNYIVVAEIEKGSPADKAGLKKNDIIETIDGISIIEGYKHLDEGNNKNVLDYFINKYNCGETVKLQIRRDDNKRKELKLKIVSVNTGRIM